MTSSNNFGVDKTLIKIDNTKESNITEFGKHKLMDGYLTPEETTAQEMFARVAAHLGDDLDHAQRLYNYMSDLWFMPASPILSNAGRKSGLGISCFLSYVDDSVEGITDHMKEAAILTTMGGGVAGHWSDVRSRGEGTSNGTYTTGTMAWMLFADPIPIAASQGTTRRGAYASYMDVSHPEIEQFLETRNPTGGDANLKCLNIHIGVNISDAFMKALQENGDWDLIDPNSKVVKKTVKARDIWYKILATRMKTGEPYVHFIDTANNAMPVNFLEAGKKINGSNLCCEIELPTDKDNTAVCCLSSVNLEKYDEWKNHPTFIEDIMRLLDNNLTDFINRAPKSLHRAVNSARRERNVGLGAFGFHGLLMKRHIPFESAMAKSLNIEIFKHLDDKSYSASCVLGAERGEAEIMTNTSRRFGHRMAVAPNASNSTICGEATPSIEPIAGNVFNQKTKAGTFVVINKYLYTLLSEKYGKCGKEMDDILLDIASNEGSVQHLEWMDKNDKDVFKTAIELDQMWVIEHAGDRAGYIDQGQSVNLFFDPNTDIGYLNKVHGTAWRKGIKGLYYLRSKAINRPRNVTKPTTNNDSDCIACEG